MKTIIVDDEPLAVQYLTKVLDDIGLTNLISSYTSSLIAKEEIIKLEPDLIFLDIEMPKLDGLTLASYLKMKLPDVKIVFVTSHEQYAIKAIELDNIDYILKPFEPNQIRDVINKIPNELVTNSIQGHPMVCCFENLRFVYFKKGSYPKENQTVDVKWRTKLTREIFAFMISNRFKNIRKDVIIETFWPEIGLKDGYNILYATIHYMRKNLKEINFPIIIENTDEYYTLHLNGVMTDVDYWLEYLNKPIDVLNLENKEAALLYRNHFLNEESYQWAEYDRQRYRIKWLENLREILNEYERLNEHSQAILFALHYQHIEPFMEESYFILMKLFAKTRDLQSVRFQYEKLCVMMDEEYNAEPCNEIKSWFKNWNGE